MEDTNVASPAMTKPVATAHRHISLRSTSTTDLSESVTATPSERQQLHRRANRRANQKALSTMVRGRMLAPGAFLGTKHWHITRQHKRGFLGTLQERVRIYSEEEDAPSTDTTEYVCLNPHNSDSFVIKDATTGQSVLECTTSHGDHRKHVVYGSRPFIAGNPSFNKVGGTPFYPWYQISLRTDGRITVEIFECRQAKLWYCEESIDTAEELNFKCECVFRSPTALAAGTITRQRGSDTSLVTIQPGTDPAVLIAIALLLPEF